MAPQLSEITRNFGTPGPIKPPFGLDDGLGPSIYLGVIGSVYG